MKNKKKSYKSICCNAPVRVEGMDDFDEVCTMHHVCTKCGKDCDVIIKVRKLWDVSPVTKVKKDEREKKKAKQVDEEIKYINQNWN